MENPGRKLNLINTKSKSVISKLDRLNSKHNKDKKNENEEDTQETVEESGRKKISKFITSFMSRPGERPVNSDYFSYIELNDYGCWVIADGCDEDRGALEASRIVAEDILKSFIANPKYSRRYLSKIIKKANDKLKSEQSRTRENKGMNASVAVILSDYSSVIYGTVGNSRVYVMKDGVVSERSKDDTLSYSMYENKKLAYSEVRFHNKRNNLVQNMGDYLDISPNISKKIQLLEGDKLLMLTYGAWEQLDDSDIEIELSRVNKSSLWVKSLENKIKMNDTTLENYTIVGIFVDKIAYLPNEKKKYNWVKIAIIAIAILLVLGALYKGYSLKVEREKIYETAIMYEEEGAEHIKNDELSRALEALELSKKEYKNLEVNPKSNFVYRTLFSPKITNITLGKQILYIERKIEQIGELEGVIAAIEKGDAHYNEHDFASAGELYEKAKSKLKNLKDLKYPKIGELENKIEKLIVASKGLEIGADLLEQGDVLVEERDVESALSKYLEAKIIFLKYEKIDLLALVSEKIDSVSRVRNRKYEQANSYEKRGYQLEGTDINGAIVHFEMAKGLFTDLGDDARRIVLEEKIVKLDELRRTLRQESLSYIKGAKSLSDVGDYEKALLTLKKSQDISVKLKDSQLLVSGFLKEGDLFISNSKPKLALEKYREAYAVSVTTNDDITQQEIKGKIEMSEKLGKVEDLTKKGDELYATKKYKDSRKEYLSAMEELKKLEKNKYYATDKYEALMAETKKKERAAWRESNWIPFI